jgi:hypothetical protein
MERRLGDEGKMTDKLSCQKTMRWALAHLAPLCSADRIERLIQLVDVSMTLPGRHYHDLPHALMVADSNDPLETLIGLFHDIVQAGVDGGLPPDCDAYLDGLVSQNERGEFCLLDSKKARNDAVFGVVKRCFNFADNHVLSPFAGQNEFLSALITCKALSEVLDVEHLAAVALGIEATVPFRKDAPSITSGYLSALRDISHRHQFPIDESDMRSHIRRAVRIANRDVRSFGEVDLVAFLDDTWGLMYESSIELRDSSSVGVTSYRQTLQKMTRFLSSLSAPAVFKQYDGEPIQSDHQHRILTTAGNLEVISDVMHAKLLAIALIESADSFGCRAFVPARLKSLPRTAVTASSMTAHDVLVAGATGKVEFDVRQSPLSYHLAKQLPRDEVRGHTDSIELTAPVDSQFIERFPTGIQSRARELARAMLL